MRPQDPSAPSIGLLVGQVVPKPEAQTIGKSIDGGGASPRSARLHRRKQARKSAMERS